MIREATFDDVPRLVEMGLAFLRGSNYSAALKENPDKMAETVMAIIGHQLNGQVLVAQPNGRVVGMLAFVVFDHFFSGEKVAGELVWWVEPEARGSVGVKLLRRAEICARELGACFMQMISPDGHTSELYERLGYQFVETAYQRKL